MECNTADKDIASGLHKKSKINEENAPRPVGRAAGDKGKQENYAHISEHRGNANEVIRHKFPTVRSAKCIL